MSLFKNPGEEGYDVLLAENGFVNDLQLAIEAALDSRNMSQADLAKALDVSEARISQMLSENGNNLKARTIARVAHALGRKVCIELVEEYAGWVLEEMDLDGALTQSPWLAKARGSLNSPSQSNDNGWAPPKTTADDDILVAA